jgi:hypothetical protein
MRTLLIAVALSIAACSSNAAPPTSTEYSGFCPKTADNGETYYERCEP